MRINLAVTDINSCTFIKIKFINNKIKFKILLINIIKNILL